MSSESAITERAKALEITLNERNAQDRMLSNRNSFVWARALHQKSPLNQKSGVLSVLLRT